MAGPRGPVFLSLPMEYLFETMTKDVPSDLGAAPLATADPKGIEELADMLAGAKNPVIIAEDSGRTAKGVSVGGDRRIARLSRGRNTEHRSDQYSADPSAAQRLRSQRSGPGQRCDFSSGGHSAVASGVDYTVTGSEGRDAGRKPAPSRASLLRLSNGSLPGGEVESSLEHLLAALKKRVSKGDSVRSRRAEELKAKNDARRKKWREEAQALANQKPMDTRWVAHEISQVLPADAMVVEETITIG